MGINSDEFKNFLNDKINNYANNILELNNRNDRSAVGELDFYVMLRNELLYDDSKNIYERASLRTKGMFDAMNDTLIELGYVKNGSHFLDVLQNS